MKEKNKLVVIFLLIILITAIFSLIFIRFYNNKEKKEILIQEEISDQQNRFANVLLYFIDYQTGELETEYRLVDIKKLVNNPYEIIINMLIEGLKNVNYKKSIPNETTINKIEFKNRILEISFYAVIFENNKNEIHLIIDKTLKELLEVEKLIIK
ncbi:MAG TPA: GerMN domain-containing protein [Clostridia bacterium]|nr:GerMN domain-containing protein [Clostridia bacterium]